MSKTLALELLKNVHVASPCSSDWDQMQGDDRVRYCAQCKLNVYNLSAMTAEEAAALVQAKEGRLCVSMFKRADGTVITADCPVGLRAIRIKAAKAVGRIAAAAAFLISGGLAAASNRNEPRLPKLASMQPFSTIRNWLVAAPPKAILKGRYLGGACVLPTPSPRTKGTGH